jgi:hypothetical protein
MNGKKKYRRIKKIVTQHIKLFLIKNDGHAIYYSHSYLNNPTIKKGSIIRVNQLIL